MNAGTLELRVLGVAQVEEIKSFFANIFTKEPWYDDWSDEVQLHAYIMDLIDNKNSLTLGLFEADELVGLTMGSIKHWYTGTEYCIDEFCIRTEAQGRGLGTCLLKEVERYITSKGVSRLFLQTERSVPAYHFYKKNGLVEMEGHVSFHKTCG